MTAQQTETDAALIALLGWALQLTMSDSEQYGQCVYGPQTTVRKALRAFEAWKADREVPP